MKMNRINELINKNIKLSLKEFIDNDNNNASNFIEDFSVKLDVYFDSEKQKLSRKMSFANRMKNELNEYHKMILNIGYEYSNIETNYNLGEYTIEYYIYNSENWTEDEFMDNEEKIYRNFQKNDFGIDINLYTNKNNISYISMSFNTDIIEELDL